MYLDEIQYTEVFAVADAKTRDAKIPQNFGLVKLQNFYGNIMSFFSTQFIIKLLIKFFNDLPYKSVKLVYYWDAKITVTFFEVKSNFKNEILEILFKKRRFRFHLQNFEIFL